MPKARYLVVVMTVAVCGMLFSYSIPNEYVAQVKVADEYKVTDLAVGLNTFDVLIRDLRSDNGNQGTDDIEIYAKILQSEDFIRQAAAAKVEKYGVTYGEYIRQCKSHGLWSRLLQLASADEEREEDALETIRDNIRFSLDYKALTLDMQVGDQDPEVAKAMLDTVTANLRQHIEQHRQKRAQANRDKARANLKSAESQYTKAIDDYNKYANSHQDLTSQIHKTMLESLRQNYLKLGEMYRKTAEKYARADYLTGKENLSFVIVKNNSLPQKPLTPRHWVYFVVFGAIAALLCLWHWLYQKRLWKAQGWHLDWGGLFSPWTLTIAIWALILILYYVLQTELYPITAQFYICLSIWLIVFCTSAFVTYNLMYHGTSDYRSGISLSHLAFNIFFAISLVITPLYVYRVWQIVNMFSTDDLMNSVRLLAVYGEGFGFLNYSNVINQSLLIVSLWARPKVPMWQVIWIAVACLLNSLAIMEKGTMFFVFICIVFVLFERKVIRVRTIVVLAAIVLVFFYVFNLARAEQDSDYKTNETLLGFVAMYALSPPVAFCQLSADITPQFGTNTFEIIYLFLERFGFKDIVVKAKLQDFVWVPIPTNVYTIFQPFFIDFGYKGIAFFAALYGVVSGWLYRLYRNGNSIGCCLYTFMAEILILQFFQENLMLSLVFMLQFVVFTILITQDKISVHFTPPSHEVPIVR